jgi:hypothetical protein
MRYLSNVTGKFGKSIGISISGFLEKIIKL